MGQVSTDLLKLPLPEVNDYEAYLRGFDLLDHGFTFAELVRPGSPRHALPPTRMWPAMVATLALALELRTRWVAAGGRGLVIAAAYRPLGGEQNSRHKRNRALDLDLFGRPAKINGVGEASAASLFARIAAGLWREHEDLKVGFGTYAPEGAVWTRRVHIDTGHRFQCWQGTGSRDGRATFAHHPAALVLAPPDETDLLSRELIADGT